MAEEANRLENLARYFEDSRIELSHLQALYAAGAKNNDLETYEVLLPQVAKFTAEMKCLTAALNSGTALADLLAARHPTERLNSCSAMALSLPPPCISPGCRGCLWDAFCV